MHLCQTRDAPSEFLPHETHRLSSLKILIPFWTVWVGEPSEPDWECKKILENSDQRSSIWWGFYWGNVFQSQMSDDLVICRRIVTFGDFGPQNWMNIEMTLWLNSVGGHQIIFIISFMGTFFFFSLNKSDMNNLTRHTHHTRQNTTLTCQSRSSYAWYKLMISIIPFRLWWNRNVHKTIRLCHNSNTTHVAYAYIYIYMCTNIQQQQNGESNSRCVCMYHVFPFVTVDVGGVNVPGYLYTYLRHRGDTVG